jgi:hypothetical protein
MNPWQNYSSLSHSILLTLFSVYVDYSVYRINLGTIDRRASQHRDCLGADTRATNTAFHQQAYAASLPKLINR